MENDYISFEDEVARGKYSREITGLLQNNNINWFASPSIKKPEIFIHPKDSPEENERAVSRISLQIKEGVISFGISGYFPARILDTYSAYENKGYKYHDKEGNTSPQQAVSVNFDGLKGRWWLTKQVNDFNQIINEFRDIGSFLH
jgi:hypothetical protein